MFQHSLVKALPLQMFPGQNHNRSVVQLEMDLPSFPASGQCATVPLGPKILYTFLPTPGRMSWKTEKLKGYFHARHGILSETLLVTFRDRNHSIFLSHLSSDELPYLSRTATTGGTVSYKRPYPSSFNFPLMSRHSISPWAIKKKNQLSQPICKSNLLLERSSILKVSSRGISIHHHLQSSKFARSYNSYGRD